MQLQNLAETKPTLLTKTGHAGNQMLLLLYAFPSVLCSGVKTQRDTNSDYARAI